MICNPSKYDILNYHNQPNYIAHHLLIFDYLTTYSNLLALITIQ